MGNRIQPNSGYEKVANNGAKYGQVGQQSSDARQGAKGLTTQGGDSEDGRHPKVSANKKGSKKGGTRRSAKR